MTLKRTENKKTYDIIAVLIFFVVFAICIYRYMFGFDWSDETLYPALSHRFLTGDRFFVEAGGAMQIAGMIMLPFTWAFEKLTGGTEGIMFYYRVLYTVFSLGIALYGYRIAAKRKMNFSGILFGILMMIYSPHSVSTMGYNNILYLTGIFSALLIIEKFDDSRLQKIKYYFGGIMCGIAVADYPPFIIAIPVMLLFIVYNNQEKARKGLIEKLKPLLFFVIGGITVASIFLLLVLFTSSFSNLIESYKIKSELNAQAKSDTSNGNILIDYIYGMLLPFKGLGIYLSLSYIFSLFYLFFKRWDQRGIVRVLILIWIVISIILHMQVAVQSGRYNFITIPVTIFFPAFYLLYPRKPDWTVFIYVVGILMALSVFAGSNTGMFGGAYGLMASNMGAVFFCFGGLKNINRKDPVSIPVSKISMGIFFASLLIVVVMSTKFSYVYRDEPCSMLDTKITLGPGAGIYTTSEAAEKYEIVYNTVVKYVGADDRVMYSKLMPFAYASTMARATPRNLYRVEINSDFTNEMLKKYPERMPTIVIVFDKAYGITNEDNIMEGYLAEELLSGKYEIIQVECGTVYRLKK